MGWITLFFFWLSIPRTATSLASHINSKGYDQSEVMRMCVEANTSFNIWNAWWHLSSKVYGWLAPNRFLCGLALWKNPLMNQIKLSMPQRLHTGFRSEGGGNLLSTSIFVGSTSNPVWEILCPRTILSVTMKWHFSKFSMSHVSLHFFIKNISIMHLWNIPSVLHNPNGMWWNANVP